jgi:hypothetical protein
MIGFESLVCFGCISVVPPSIDNPNPPSTRAHEYARALGRLLDQAATAVSTCVIERIASFQTLNRAL